MCCAFAGAGYGMVETSPLRQGEGDSAGTGVPSDAPPGVPSGAPSGVPSAREKRTHRLQATASAVAERLQRLSQAAFNISALASLASLYVGYSEYIHLLRTVLHALWYTRGLPPLHCAAVAVPRQVPAMQRPCTLWQLHPCRPSHRPPLLPPFPRCTSAVECSPGQFQFGLPLL